MSHIEWIANSFLNKAITLKYMKRYDEAITAFREYLKFQPKHDGVYDEIGRILQEQGKLQESADAFSQAIRLAPGYAQFYQDRAVTYYNMKDYMRAKEDMDAAKRLGGNINPQFEAALQMRLKETK